MIKVDHGKKILALILALVLTMAGCDQLGAPRSPIDPKQPVTIVLWNYYNGQTKENFDKLISRFNDTVGIEKGIVVDAYSHGDVQQLADAVFDSANKKIGSKPLPHIFAAYPDNAYRVDQLAGLVDMEAYFSPEELAEYRQDFLGEGRFGQDAQLKIIPVAKSTENLFLNKTTWDAFAAETGADIQQLSTWEGLAETAEKYYMWTDAKTASPNDGKAFLGIDSPSNFILSSAVQMGAELYTYKDGKAVLNFNETMARKVWENCYIPYLKGHYLKTGRFCSDDAKVGRVAAYVGSTAGAGYFPKEITLSESEVFPIACAALPYPRYVEGSAVAIQQGAGMCITKSDEAHEYAAAEFLKWFTAKEQNTEFAVSTGYLPVKVSALTEEALLPEGGNAGNAAIAASVKATVSMLGDYVLYGNKPFDGSYEMRQLLETSLQKQVQKDLEAGQTEADSEKNFALWYGQFTKAAAEIMK